MLFYLFYLAFHLIATSKQLHFNELCALITSTLSYNVVVYSNRLHQASCYSLNWLLASANLFSAAHISFILYCLKQIVQFSLHTRRLHYLTFRSPASCQLLASETLRCSETLASALNYILLFNMQTYTNRLPYRTFRSPAPYQLLASEHHYQRPTSGLYYILLFNMYTSRIYYRTFRSPASYRTGYWLVYFFPNQLLHCTVRFTHESPLLPHVHISYYLGLQYWLLA